MEELNKEKLLYKISPNFNILYEIFRPTGKKIKNTIISILILFVLLIILFMYGKTNEVLNFVIFSDMSVLLLSKIIFLILSILFVLKLIFHIVFQMLQYKHITYSFYENYMTYEDDFLNQHKKNIKYTDVKEVEIRRTIWDRILNYGIVVLYTNAEYKRNNGMVIYAIKNPRDAYDKIDNIINISKEKNNEKNNKILEKSNINIIDDENVSNDNKKINQEIVKNNELNNDIKNDVDLEYSSEENIKKRVEVSKNDQKEFLDSLKDINNE